MKLKFLLIFVLIPYALFAAVTVPEFSFTGEEIGHYDTKLSFSNVNIIFNGQKDIDQYLDDMKIDIEDLKASEYSAKDPGSMYDSSFGTRLSSMFVGDKAFINFFTKQYLNKNYLEISAKYNDYIKEVKNIEFKKEIDFIYALSLLELGRQQKSFQILDNLSRDNGSIGKYSQDKIFKIYYDIKDYNSIDNLKLNIDRLTPFALSVILSMYAEKKMYDEMIDLIDNYNEYIEQNKVLNDYQIVAYYNLKEFEKVQELSDSGTKSTLPLVIDVLIEREDYVKAEQLIGQLEQLENAKFLRGKLAITINDYKSAATYISEIDDDNLKLNLLFYYYFRKFPKLDSTFFNVFKFKNPMNNDYLEYYKGVNYLKEKMPHDSVDAFDKISFNQNIIRQSSFYKGVAYVTIDIDKSEKYLLEYLNYANDDEKIIVSKFILAQYQFLQSNNIEALEYISKCEQDYCKELRAEIFIRQGKNNDAIKVLSGINSDKSKFLKGAAYFNIKEYKKALESIQTLKDDVKETALLKMLLYFKIGNIHESIKIYYKYPKDNDFKNNAVKYLYLNGRYKEILEVLNDNNLTEEFTLVKANSLYSLNKYEDAEILYINLLNKKIYAFEALSGLLAINQHKGKSKNFLSKAITLINSLDFEKKDFLTIQLAKYAIDIDELDKGTILLNNFAANYPKSEYKKDSFIAKAIINQKRKKVEDCVKDVNSALSISQHDEEAYNIKAQCVKIIDKKQAVSIYEYLANNSKRFKDTSLKEIIFLTDNIAQLKEAVSYFKGKEKYTYLDGIVRLLNFAELEKNFLDYEKFIYELIEPEDKMYAPVGLYFLSVANYVKGDYMQASKSALKSYYIYPKSDYAVRALNLAKQSFYKLNDNTSVEKIDNLINSGNKGGN